MAMSAAESAAAVSALGERMSRLEVGLNQGGTYVETIMGRVGVSIDGIGRRIELTETAIQE